MSNYANQGLSRQDIRDISRAMRVVFRLGDGYIDVVYLIENIIPEFDSKFEWEICGKDNMQPGVYAYYDPVINKLTISEETYYGACNGIGRDRFTLAHEVGHYLLHSDQAALQRVSPDIPLPAFRDPEWQANTFASEFLAPYDKVKYMTKEQVAQQYGLSLRASEIAIYNAKKPN